MFKAIIQVTLKKGVSDPEGVNTLKAIHLLGFDTVVDAKTMRTFILQLDGKDKDTVKKDVEKICQRLLTNPVIHDYKIEVHQT
jgi:phosphoribosylformylglycinamidine synthase subunit PurS